ncbi:MAG TPA: hypothetical protein VLM42_08820 [Bryobacteraceae bacterium]|nr:hypothetical protein [Bryobacteraceae bacterium]
MNYRRGFQRVYAVLTVVWIAGLILALPNYRVRFWQKQRGEASLADVDLAKSGIATTTKGDIFDQIDAERHKQPYDLPKGAVPVDPNGNGGSFVPDEPVATETRTEKFLWLAGVLFGPPIAGYAAIFLVVPWVFRGFRPSASSAP